MKYPPWYWPIVTAALMWLSWDLGHRLGLSKGYGSDASHDETLDLMLKCADDLMTCHSERQTLAVSCMKACKGCPDVCEMECDERD